MPSRSPRSCLPLTLRCPLPASVLSGQAPPPRSRSESSGRVSHAKPPPSPACRTVPAPHRAAPPRLAGLPRTQAPAGPWRPRPPCEGPPLGAGPGRGAGLHWTVSWAHTLRPSSQERCGPSLMNAWPRSAGTGRGHRAEALRQRATRGLPADAPRSQAEKPLLVPLRPTLGHQSSMRKHSPGDQAPLPTACPRPRPPQGPSAGVLGAPAGGQHRGHAGGTLLAPPSLEGAKGPEPAPSAPTGRPGSGWGAGRVGPGLRTNSVGTLGGSRGRLRARPRGLRRPAWPSALGGG